MTEHEQTIRTLALQWLDGQPIQDQQFQDAIQDYVLSIPVSRVGMPYCPACESVLCGACRQCHSLDLMPWDPPCPLDCDTMGRDCAAWWQAFNAVMTVQHQEGS